MSVKAWVLVASLAVNLYLLGVMVVFAAVLYPSFGSVERGVFPSLYDGFNARIGAPVVVWEFAALLVALGLYASRPEGVPLVAVHAVTVLGLAYFAITFGWHLPSHRLLAAGDNSAAALAPLLRSQWARTAIQLVRALVLGWMSAKAMS